MSFMHPTSLNNPLLKRTAGYLCFKKVPLYFVFNKMRAKTSIVKTLKLTSSVHNTNGYIYIFTYPTNNVNKHLSIEIFHAGNKFN